MREFFQVINEYPWTAFFVAVFIISSIATYRLMAKKSNTLTSHHGESNSSRADKMSGWVKDYKKDVPATRGKMSKAKKISGRKRRMFLKNPKFFEKI